MGFDANQAREWVNQNSAAVTIGSVVVLIFALAYLWIQNKAPSAPNRGVMQAYYFDVTTGEQFIYSGDELPPIVRENGNKAYKVYIFTCGECTNQTERFVGYYEGFTPDFKKKRQDAIESAKNAKPDGGPMPGGAIYFEEGLSAGRMLSADAKAWYASDAPEGIAINVALSKACETKGGRLRPCYPGVN